MLAGARQKAHQGGARLNLSHAVKIQPTRDFEPAAPHPLFT